MIRKLFILLYKLKTKYVQNRYRKYCSIPKSTILMSGFSIRSDRQMENRNYVTVGEKSVLNCKIIFDADQGNVKIGGNVYLGSVMLISRSSIEIGNDVTMAWGITIYDHDSHSVYWEYRKNDNIATYNDMISGGFSQNKDWSHVETAPIVIGDKVWIGFDSVILKGVHIGEGAVVAAKSVVTKDVPPFTVVAGNPASVVKNLLKEEDGSIAGSITNT